MSAKSEWIIRNIHMKTEQHIHLLLLLLLLYKYYHYLNEVIYRMM